MRAAEVEGVGNMDMVCSWLSGRLLLNAVRNPLLDQFMFKVRWYRRKFYLCRVDGLPDIQVDQSVFVERLVGLGYRVDFIERARGDGDVVLSWGRNSVGGKRK